MLSTFAVAAALATGALAMQVTSPNQYVVWDASQTSQTVTWTYVNTDATSLAMVLVNQDRSVLPTNNQLLAANVSTSSGQASVTYPSGSWPVGAGFQVNLIRDSTDPNTIYAQSNDFNITSSGSMTSSSSGTTTALATSVSGTPTTLIASIVATTATGSGSSASVASGSVLSGSTLSDTLPGTTASPTPAKSGASVTMRLTGPGMALIILGLATLGSVFA